MWPGAVSVPLPPNIQLLPTSSPAAICMFAKDLINALVVVYKSLLEVGNDNVPSTPNLH